MSFEFIIAIIISGALLLAIIGLTSRKIIPRKLNQEYYQKRWMALLERVKTPEGMVLAVIDADKLLDDALKKSHFKGRTMGERLVKAQRSISDNDAVWYAHKLRNRLVHEPDVRLRESEAKQALSGFRQTLKDLGAL